MKSDVNKVENNKSAFYSKINGFLFGSLKNNRYLCISERNNITPSPGRAQDKMKANGIKVFESINLDIEEVAEFIENNGLSFTCNEEMNVEASEEDFNKLIEQFPELDYVEL